MEETLLQKKGLLSYRSKGGKWRSRIANWPKEEVSNEEDKRY